MSKIFEHRCKQLYPRDILVAYVPSKKNPNKGRAVGVLRRSFTFDKIKGCSTLTIDFVWVMPDVRGCGCGRALMAAGLVAGKPKDVHLQVAGSQENKTAVALYSSLGFEWDEDAPDHTEMFLPAPLVLEAAAKASARREQPPPPPQQQQEEELVVVPPTQQQCEVLAAAVVLPPRIEVQLSAALGGGAVRLMLAMPRRAEAEAAAVASSTGEFADATNTLPYAALAADAKSPSAKRTTALRMRERASGECGECAGG